MGLGPGVSPSPEKLQRTSNSIVGLPLIFGIWLGVFPISTARRPIQMQSATRRPDCAWTVGIASLFRLEKKINIFVLSFLMIFKAYIKCIRAVFA